MLKPQKKNQRLINKDETLVNNKQQGVGTGQSFYTSNVHNNNTPPGNHCQFSELANLSASSTSPVLGLRPLPQYPLTARQAWTLGKLAVRIGRPRLRFLKEACGIDVDIAIPYLSKTQASRLIKIIIESQEVAR